MLASYPPFTRLISPGIDCAKCSACFWSFLVSLMISCFLLFFYLFLKALFIPVTRTHYWNPFETNPQEMVEPVLGPRHLIGLSCSSWEGLIFVLGLSAANSLSLPNSARVGITFPMSWQAFKFKKNSVVSLVMNKKVQWLFARKASGLKFKFTSVIHIYI